jgi:hypothetical protein
MKQVLPWFRIPITPGTLPPDSSANRRFHSAIWKLNQKRFFQSNGMTELS